MGTNFYWHESEDSEPKHIGKALGGWCFSLHVYPDDGINDLTDWKPLFRSGFIRDEYDREISADDMHSIIVDRHGSIDWTKPPRGYADWETFHRQNHSERGPLGLLRRDLGYGCIAHGAGTWDCIVGGFS